MKGYSARQIAGSFVSLIGVAIGLSGLVLNPWVAGRLLGLEGVRRADVLAGYFAWSLLLGALVFAFGWLVATGRARRFEGPGLLVLFAAFLILGDRLLLVAFGLPLWIHDPQLHYRNRPNKVMPLRDSRRSGDVIRINRYGHHDDDFPEAKPDRELRGLMIGDSVTMGDGVPYRDTFSSQLEQLLASADRGYATYQVINTGVHGYSVFQEQRILEESLRFEPDFIGMGFCMNDVTEPFVNNADFGGVGLDYHGVTQTPAALLGWLWNETGVGRLIQKLREPHTTIAAEKRKELYSVREMTQEARTNPRYAEAFEIVLGDLDKVYAVVGRERVPFVLMIFPFTFQLIDPTTHVPQEILAEHARAHGIDVIDFTPIFRDAVFDDRGLVEDFRARGYSPEDITRFFEWRVRKFFRDADHLTRAGHAVVAETLLRHFEERGAIPLPRP